MQYILTEEEYKAFKENSCYLDDNNLYKMDKQQVFTGGSAPKDGLTLHFNNRGVYTKVFLAKETIKMMLDIIDK